MAADREADDLLAAIAGNIGEGNVGAGLAIFGSTLVQQVPQLAAVAATGGAAGLDPCSEVFGFAINHALPVIVRVIVCCLLVVGEQCASVVFLFHYVVV